LYTIEVTIPTIIAQSKTTYSMFFMPMFTFYANPKPGTLNPES